MAMIADDIFNDYVECTVCGSDTALLCSPCGDPICHNCACPNGCEAALSDRMPRSMTGQLIYVDAAA